MATRECLTALTMLVVAALAVPTQALGQVSNTNPTGLFVYPAEDQGPEQQQQAALPYWDVADRIALPPKARQAKMYDTIP